MSNFRDAQIEQGMAAFEQDFTTGTYPTVEACREAAVAYGDELTARGVEGWDMKTLFLVPDNRTAENVAGYKLEWAEWSI